MLEQDGFAVEKSITLRDGREVLLRVAAPTDVAALLEIHRQIIQEGITNVATVIPSTEKLTEDIKETTDSITFVADYVGQAVASLKLSRGWAAYVQHHLLLAIGIHRDFRSGGLGTALMHHGAAWARHYHFEFIRLGVFDSNPRAVAFYERLGYREYGRLPHYLKRLDGSYSTSIEMVLEL